MGCSAREKRARANRRQQLTKVDADHSKVPPQPKSTPDSRPKTYPISSSHILPNFSSSSKARPNPNPDSGTPSYADCGWSYFTEEQMEEMLYKNLGFLFSEAAKKLVSMGYSQDAALKALLRNGHCYGSMDVLTNIMNSALFYLNGGGDCCANHKNADDDSEFGLADLRQLVDYSIAGMLCLLQQVRPHLSKGDAMWCLLMSDLHVGKASTMEVPKFPPPPTNGGGKAVTNNVKGVGNSTTSAGVETAALCCPNCNWSPGSGDAGTEEPPASGASPSASQSAQQRKIDSHKKSNLCHPVKKNAAPSAAGYQANSKQSQTQCHASESSVSSEGASKGPAPVVDMPDERSEESYDSENQEVVDTMLEEFKNLNLDENLEEVSEERKEEILAALANQIKDMERQVKDRKEWAQHRAIQAARKLGSDLTELKILRIEREETQKLKKGTRTLDDITMKRLSEMENALRRVSGQVDRANAAVRHLEIENAELKALIEGYKLDASESANASLQVAKREKKLHKKLMNQEKQKEKFQEEIAAEKQKISELRKLLEQINEAGKEAEAKWKDEVVAKEQAMAQLEEEKRAKEETEANNRRRLEVLQAKIEFDFQRHRDDLQRLEQELSHLKATAGSDMKDAPDPLLTDNSKATRSTEQATVTKLFNELAIRGRNFPNRGRYCLICEKDEVSIVFLPCAHQVVCSSCGTDYGKERYAACPCCGASIEEVIQVYGASS